MSTCRFTALAAGDLEEIHDYIALDSTRAALHFVQRLDKRCRELSELPLIGRSRPDILPALRSVTEGRYVIFYRQVPEGVEILRVLHSARDVNRLIAG